MTASETTPQSMTSAEDLRKRALELQLAEMGRDEKIKAREATKHAEFVEDFSRSISVRQNAQSSNAL
ncbi:hypothetical protein LPU83_3747 [Rhizobium favelukesii]|uniref:Uncharacterized protein n=1 Tax=Rhizobium favelukesii TaxID=348824 RepID=W6RGC8_9HYPH|nr:hypothetical protein LPU83_3747 [Rhizobium favelukesii]